MQYDIYSLGVCFFEIGLWWFLVWYLFISSLILLIYYYFNYINLLLLILIFVFGYLLQLRKYLSDWDFEYVYLLGFMLWIKEDFVLLIKQIFLQCMGWLYIEIVVDCFICLDDGNNEFGSLDVIYNKQDLIVVGIKFVERILGKIEGIMLQIYMLWIKQLILWGS